MTKILLVHGAWQSARCWDNVLSSLGSLGKEAVAVALTGLGSDNGNLTREVGLSIHVEDVVRAIDSVGGSCVMAGHSYGGMVVTGACEKRPDRVLGVVYLDAFVPEDGQSALQLLPQPVAQMFQSMAEEKGAGWRLPAGEFLLDIWGVRDLQDRVTIRHDLSDFSIECFREVLRLPYGHARTKRRGYIAAGLNHDYSARAVFAPFVQQARTGGWLLAQLDAGHACEVEKPTEVSEAIANVVDRAGKTTP